MSNQNPGSPLKRLSARVNLWLAAFAVCLLLDEYLKEGYFFDPSDLSKKPVSHEHLVVASLVLLAANVLRKILKSKFFRGRSDGQ